MGNDAHAELERLAAELRRAVLSVAWRQWRTIGAGAATRSARSADRERRSPALVDPEALVLVSLVLMADERRLADLLHDWAARNSDLLSVQRMKNLEADYAEPERGALTQRLAWFATVARDAGKDLRWRAMAQAWTAHAQQAVGGAGELPAPRGEPGAGSRPKARATRASLTSGASLLLRLRLGFGVGVKADLLAFLLARADQPATVREIAAATAYTPAAVRRATEDLAAARLIVTAAGVPASYRIAWPAWAPLLGAGLDDRPPRWGSWHDRFVFATAFLHWADTARGRPLSRYALGARGRELLERYRSAFERDEVAVWSAHTMVEDWAAFVRQAVEALIGWMEGMA